VCHVCVAMIHAETGTVDQKAPYLCRMAEETIALMEAEREALAQAMLVSIYER